MNGSFCSRGNNIKAIEKQKQIFFALCENEETIGSVVLFSKFNSKDNSLIDICTVGSFVLSIIVRVPLSSNDPF